MAFRLDRGTLQRAKRLADGRLVAPATFTRTGVFVYRDGQGKEIREYRAPSEVFDEASMATFAMVPLTDDHPPESLDANNARQFAVGATGEGIKRDGSHLAGTIMVFDAETIEKMDAGKVELSCGYQADVVMGSGISPDGEHYDAVQKRIRGNHVAIVDVGRAGPTARVRMDASVQVADAAPGDTMDPDLKAALADAATQKARADKAEADLAAANTALAAKDTEIATVTGERDDAKTQLVASEKKRTDAETAEPARIRARVELETAATPIIKIDGKAPEAKTLAKMTDRAIKVAVVKAVDAVEIDDKKEPAYVQARFDSALERAQKADAVLTDLRTDVEPPADTELNARDAMDKRNREAAN